MTQMLKKSGYSLIEISFAFLLFGMAVLPIFGVLMDSMSGVARIEPYRVAQEKGYNIMMAVMTRVPFEMLWESVGEWQPASIRAYPSSAEPAWNDEYALKLVDSIFPGSTEACHSIVTIRGIEYEILLEVTDIASADTENFSGSDWSDPATWNELYFDYYPLPDFFDQPDWNNKSNVHNNSAISGHYITPYRYYGTALPGRLWGPAERLKSGKEEFGVSFPRSQKDRARRWHAWGNKYCSMKKLRLKISWQHAESQNRPGSSELYFVAFRADIDSTGWQS